MKRYYVLVLFFLLSPCVLAKVEITEIMFNPEDSNEWVEFFNSGEELTLSGVTVADNYQADQITCCENDCLLLVSNESYFLVLEKGTTLNTSGKHVFCVDDTTIGNGLGNTGDEIYLFQGNETFLNLTYNVSVDKGFSLALVNGTWSQAVPSPGKTNNNIETTEEEPKEERIESKVIDKQIYTFVNYNSLFMLHNLNYPTSLEEVNVTVHYNVSHHTENTTFVLYDEIINTSLKHTSQINGNFSFNSSGDFLLFTEIFFLNTTRTKGFTLTIYDSTNTTCNVSLVLDLEKNVFEKNESIAFDHILSNTSFGFEIEYWVEDLFGNEIKEKQKTNNLNIKQFSPDFDEQDKVYFIKSNLTMISCNNTGNNTFSEKLVVVKGDILSETNKSRINITDVPEEAIFGDILTVDIDIYKGDTRKTLVESYLKGSEKISAVTGAKINKKFHEIQLSLPILLKDNCDKRYPEGEYNLIIEGIDTYTEKQVSVRHNPNCVSEDKKKSSLSRSSSSASSQVSQPKDKSYELLSVIQDVFSSEVISSIKINNIESMPHTYEIWSYLYKGSVSYSGDRGANKIKLELGPSSDKTIILRAKVSSVHPKELTHKIKILREDRKTPYEITQNISLKEEEVNMTETNKTENLAELSKPEFYRQQEIISDENLHTTSQEEPQEIIEQNQRITGNIIYESKTEKLKNNTLVFVIFTLILGILAFIKLRPKNGF